MPAVLLLFPSSTTNLSWPNGWGERLDSHSHFSVSVPHPGNSRWLEFIAGQSPSPDKSRERNAYMFSTQLAFSLLRQFRIQTHSGLGLPTPINIIKTIPPDMPMGQQDLDNPPLRLFSRWFYMVSGWQLKITITSARLPFYLPAP